jgi:hypothetical protein
MKNQQRNSENNERRPKGIQKKRQKKSEIIFTKRLKQIHNIIIGYSKEMWVDRTQAIENYLKTSGIREEINKAKKEANKKRKDKINANKEIDTELRDLQEDSDQSEEEEETSPIFEDILKHVTDTVILDFSKISKFKSEKIWKIIHC